MARPRVSAGGGVPALLYSWRMGRQAGGFWKLYKRLRSKNACKTCALGMGGQAGGMVNEGGHFPEVCKKSLQAQAADMIAPLAPDFFAKNSIELLGKMTPRQLEFAGRLSYPVMAGPDDSHYRPVSWEEAFSRAGEAFKGVKPEETFFYASGRSSNEAAFLLQLIARAYGTNNVHNCSYYCHSASGVALAKVYGSGTASVVLDDLQSSDFVMVVGANPASNHPRLLTQLMHLRRRGGKVVVVNPLKELGLVRFRVPSDWRSMLWGSQVSDLYIQPRVGTDVAFFQGVLKALLATKGIDEDFIAQHTEGWDALVEDIKSQSWDDISETCGVSKRDMEQVAAMLFAAERGIFCWAMGLTHHAHGVDNILALSNVALAKGWLGRPGCGLMPIRGHSNVQGVGSVGVSPKLKQDFAEKIEKLYGLSLPSHEGQHTYASMQAAHAGEVRGAFYLGGNLYGSNPDLDWAEKALRSIDASVFVSTKLNPGHIFGRGKTSIILPALARDEEQQATTQESMFNFVRMSEGGTPAVAGEMRSEVDIVASFAQEVLPEGIFDWSELRSHEALRSAIAQIVPGYEPIDKIAKDGEFQIPGRTFHQPEFNTPTGKAQFFVTKQPKDMFPEDSLRLITIRSEGQFNTVVYDEEDLYRGADHRYVVLMAQEDVKARNFVDGDWVLVETSTGSLKVQISVCDIRSGSIAMYFPEANVLVPQTIDSQSKTPAFKGIAAYVKPLEKSPLSVVSA